MPFHVPIDDARSLFPQYDFVSSLTPSAQKAAFHVRDDEGIDLCLKIVSPDYDVDRLGREIEALQQINHPNVVKLYEYTFSSTPGSVRHYLIEESIEGNDLADELQTAPWEPARIYATFAELADGLTALEEIDVVHRDLKPQNVRIRTDGRPVIIDFGLARHLNLSDLTRTDEGAELGTPLYFAPEQFLGTKRDIDRRTDLFAFGVMLFQAAKMAADAIGVPVLGSAVLARSATSSLNTLETSLSAATSLPADGWYYAFEFNPARIPHDQDEVYRFCYGALKLAC